MPLKVAKTVAGDKKKANIVCPYCFETFSDSEVHFRMETYFQDESQDDVRSKFLLQEDSAYKNYWNKFGGIYSEKQDSTDIVKPYLLPVLNPAQALKDGTITELRMTESGFIYSAVDCFGNETKRRVCPKCHNPLPSSFGRNNVKFISVLGSAGAGKTVFLSQICKYLPKTLAAFNINATPSNDFTNTFAKQNPVLMESELPSYSTPGVLAQPVCFDMVSKVAGKMQLTTFVFYDIAGEDCSSPEGLSKFSSFIKHSDGILLLLDPVEFGGQDLKPTEVLNTIWSLYSSGSTEYDSKLPLGICITKGDLVENQLIGEPMDDLTLLFNATKNEYVPKFFAKDYNKYHVKLKDFINRYPALRTQLYTRFDNFNYFLFSSLGAPTKLSENGSNVPAAPVQPKRIMEPILWLLLNFKMIMIEGAMMEPKDWKCPDCGRLRRITEEYCPTCKINREGKWKCPVCQVADQTGEWCITPKCNTDRFGEKKSIIQSIFTK